ncbi:MULTISPECIES: stage II sporulation protein M [unclassified Methanosarcina]|uniref:stage II sporulation protein M n=1 Tax=unclassified Methanosarcina TaxID=2644672 RepID=UPI000615BA6A|nr:MULTISPECIES: stage II sporulation protein M [unclassified Methanosarcina]AKB19503.1 Integral membrane protein [Methanosarcina sp. WWM596]AKB22678.1 Integral membrane protein [Methanosarcina sp. WH1]
MEREEDDYLRERNEEVGAETPEGEREEKIYTPVENAFLADTGDAKSQSGGRSASKVSEFTSYLRFIWPYVLIITFVFFGALLVGYTSLANFPDMADKLMEGFSSRFAPLLAMPPIFIMLGIFLNNAFVSLLFLVLGLAFGVLPVMFIAFNGYVVGVISHFVAQEKGLLFIILALLPHGIVELPMVFLSAGIGLRLGHQVFSALIGRSTEIKKEFKEGLRFYFHWILPLLFLAAIVETFITPLILNFL